MEKSRGHENDIRYFEIHSFSKNVVCHCEQLQERNFLRIRRSKFYLIALRVKFSSQSHRRTEYQKGSTVISLVLPRLCTVLVRLLAKSATSPAHQCTCSSAFQQLDSNAFSEGKGHMCSMKACLIDHTLLPLAFHKKSTRNLQ